jgi:hypothetical protein
VDVGDAVTLEGRGGHSFLCELRVEGE